MRNEEKTSDKKVFAMPYGNMIIYDPDAFLAAKMAVDSGRYGSIGSEAFEIRQQETQPLEGYEEPENFPGCCDYHRQLFEVGEKKYLEFPDCCEGHKKLNEAPWFRKENYSYLPLKLVKTIAYTWHCIEKNIYNDNWQKEIADYIVYTKESYGQFPKGYGGSLGKDVYLYNLERRLEADTELPAERREALLEMVKDFSKPQPENEREDLPDLNKLVSIYREWLSFFPFELSFFKKLKAHFESQTPILENLSEPNIYTGLVGGKLKSESALVNWLVELTESILREVNTFKLHEQGELTDASGIQLELLLAQRRQKLEKGYSNASPDTQTRCRRIVKEWLKDEKKFLKELIPFLQNKPLPSSGVKANALPIFTEQAITDFFEIVKDSFPKKQQPTLQALLKGRKPKEKLLFQENGNKLADALKQLFEANLITGCQKKDLERWILDHFEYQSRGDIKSFKVRSLSDIISSNKDKCSNPLLNVTLDKTTGKYIISRA